MSGYNDPQKLKDAIALAQSFGSGKGKDKNKRSRSPSVSSFRPQYSNFHAPPPAPAKSTGLAPPPSQRNYAGASTFLTPGSRGNVGGVSVIGSSGLDFLRRQDVPAQKPTANQASQGNVANKQSPAIPSAADQKASNGWNHQSAKDNAGPNAVKVELDQRFNRVNLTPTFSETSSEGGVPASNNKMLQTGHSRFTTSGQASFTSSPAQGPERDKPTASILDTFLSLVSQGSGLGQEIDAIAKRLPDAMDLNGPASREPTPGSKTVTGTTNDKDVHEKDCSYHHNGQNVNEFKKESQSFSNTQQIRTRAGHVFHSDSFAAPRTMQHPLNTGTVPTSSASAFAGRTPSQTSAAKPLKGLSASRWAT